MNYKHLLSFALGFAAASLIAVLIFVILPGKKGNTAYDFGSRESGITEMSEEDIDARQDFLQDMSDMLECIDCLYTEEKDYAEIYNHILHETAAALNDPYSEYYSPEEYTELLKNSQGRNTGLGVMLNLTSDGDFYVLECFENGGAYMAGVRIGDRIVSVDGTDVDGFDMDDITRLMAGEPGSVCRLGIISKDGKYFETEALRSEYTANSVISEILEGDIGYIRVLTVTLNTDEEFSSALKELKKQGAKGLIIDLMNNGGGYEEAVRNMIDMFLPAGRDYLYTVDASSNRVYWTSQTKVQNELPTVVLVNGYTASAAELFAGVLKKECGAVIIGQKTFGKGIAQEVIPLTNNDRAFKLTRYHYYFSDGESINHVGLVPDVQIDFEENGLIANRENAIQKALQIFLETSGK